ncbi:MAG: threonine aldolase [Bacteroidia bacterium]|nr:MAG: threonine aldolase [Bacteroidia bacterium]
MKSFGSDNYSGVHPRILEALVRANVGHVPAYGDDPHTQEALQKVRSIFSPRAEVFFVFNGTGGNAIALQACTRPYQSILTATTGHIAVDECNAPGRLTGCQIRTIDTPDGKLTPALVEQHLTGFGVPHHSQPHAVYISQCTELGTVYTPEEISSLATMLHGAGMMLCMDGARLANAAAYLRCSLADITTACGVDIVTLGGTKNGLMFGEAVVALSIEAQGELPYIRKQTTQLASKMRYISAQFAEYLTDDLWLRNAQQANAMARRLRQGLEELPFARLPYAQQSNQVFVILPPEKIARLEQDYVFYIWDEAQRIARLVCSFDTTEEEVDGLLAVLRE